MIRQAVYCHGWVEVPADGSYSEPCPECGTIFERPLTDPREFDRSECYHFIDADGRVGRDCAGPVRLREGFRFPTCESHHRGRSAAWSEPGYEMAEQLRTWADEDAAEDGSL